LARTAFPFNDAVGAEETFWLAARSAAPPSLRHSLNSLPKAHSPKKKALELARMYLHDNARHLYGEMK